MLKRCKMKIKNLLSLILMIFCSTIFFAACFTQDTSYIDIVGLQTIYYVGDDIDVSSSKIHYYESKDSETYTKADLKKDMISGFSTDTIGTFSMTITYNNVTKSIDYEVKSIESKPIEISEDEATTIIDTTLAHMPTYAEIKETTTTTIWGMTDTFYTITTQTKQYHYENDESLYWIVPEDDVWKYYCISYDVLDDIVEHKRLTVYTEASNLISFQYSSLINNSFTQVDFVEALKIENNYIITYHYPNMMDMYVDITIKDNQLVSQTSYTKQNNNKKTSSVTTYTYYETETNIIPEIPDKEWEEGGYYIKS